MLYFCIQILLNPQATADDKKWATAIAASIVSDGDIEIEGLEDVQPEEIEVITGEAYEIHEVDELELLKEIAEVSTEIE